MSPLVGMPVAAVGAPGRRCHCGSRRSGTGAVAVTRPGAEAARRNASADAGELATRQSVSFA